MMGANYSVHINDLYQVCIYACVDSAAITVTLLTGNMPIGT